MKLRIFTSMMVVVFLSLFGAFSAKAGDGCCKDACGHHHWRHHHGCWGHNSYIYGPDGHYARCKSACEKKCETKSNCCEKKMVCKDRCGNYCHHTYVRARYHEDCCGHGHLHYGSCKSNRDNDNDD